MLLSKTFPFPFNIKLALTRIGSSKSPLKHKAQNELHSALSLAAARFSNVLLRHHSHFLYNLICGGRIGGLLPDFPRQADGRPNSLIESKCENPSCQASSYAFFVKSILVNPGNTMEKQQYTFVKSILLNPGNTMEKQQAFL